MCVLITLLILGTWSSHARWCIILSCRHQSFTLILEEDASGWMMHQRRNTPCIASALPWIQSSCWARAMWGHSSKTNTCNPTAASVEALASNQLSQVPGKLTRRLTTAEASVHKSAFCWLIILQYTIKYLVLVSYLFTEHQKLLAAEKAC